MATSFSLYAYEPNKPLPIIFSVIIFGLGVYHWVQTVHRYKWKRFGWTMIWATLVWLTGFIARAYSVYHPQNVPVFITQYVLILAGPPIYAAAETFILGRLYAYLPYHALIHPGRVLFTFFILGAVVEALAANGASRLAGNTGTRDKDIESRKLGLALIKTSLILQAVLEVFFFTLVGLLQYRCTRPGNHFPRNVKVMCRLLYVTSSMMFLRCVVRVIEGFEVGTCGPPTKDNPLNHCGTVTTHEWFLWVFEVANIVIFVAALAVFTPGKYLSKDDKRFLDPHDGITERDGPGFGAIDKRPFIATLCDPFNSMAMLRGKKAFEDFWEQDWPVAEGVSFAEAKGASRSKRLQRRNGKEEIVVSAPQQLV